MGKARRMEKGFNTCLKNITIRANFMKERRMVQAPWCIKTETFIKGNGKREKNTAMENNYKNIQAPIMKENGKMEKKMAKVFKKFLKNNTLMELLSNPSSMALGQSSSLMETTITANTKTADSMGKESIFGRTGLRMMAISRRVIAKARGDGNRVRQAGINT